MIFADKLITLRKKAGWSQEELAEKLGVTRQSVSKWEDAQSVPDIDKILQLSRLFGVTTDYLLKEEQGEPEYTAEDDTPALRKVTPAQAGDYPAKAQANAPKMALATALCIITLIMLNALSAWGRFGLREGLAAGLGLTVLLVLVACGVYAFVWAGTIHSAMDQLLEEDDYTRDAKARKGAIGAVSAVYWLAVVAIFLFYTFGPYGNGQPQYSWFIWAIAGVVFAAVMVITKAVLRRKQ